MLESVVRSSLKQRIVVVVCALVAFGFGIHAAQNLSVDAFPDVTNIQVQVATEVPGRSPDEVERLVTIPVEIGMTGLPGLTELRSQNEPGLSIVTLVFTDDTPQYFARQLVSERMNDVRGNLPPGLNPVLGPVTTALSEVYQYTIERTDDGERPLSKEELIDRRLVQDWVARPLLRSIPGVAEINSIGGYVKQYQVLVDPFKMNYYDVTIHDVHQALSRNNDNSSGGILPIGPEILLVRSLGLARTLDDIRSIVLKEVGATPVYIRDVAEVQIGEEVRYGAMVKGGYTESVGGIVMMVAGGNAKQIVSEIQARVADINTNGMLPDGLQIVPYYDRSDLVDAALHTVSSVLIEGIVLVMIILFLYLGDVRSSVIVIATLVLTPALTFLVMNHFGMSANLMSLGGLAIAIGLIVDGSVVVVENVFERLGKQKTANKLKVVYEAVMEVGQPVIFGVGVIILVFLPLMTLEGMEGKMFAPLAYTIVIALAISLILCVTLSPVLCFFLLKGGGDHDTFLVRLTKTPYLFVLRWAVGHRKSVIALALALFFGTLALTPRLGTSFIPEMKEGSISPNADRFPNISLEESLEMELEIQRLIRSVSGTREVVSRLGRGESPVDPAGYSDVDVIVQLTPREDRPERGQDDIAGDIRELIDTLPGLNLVMAQPISDRVDEMVTGVRADVAVKIFGDDLDSLVAKAREVARVASTVPGAADFKIDRVMGQQNLNITIDRAAIARHGLNISDVNDVVEAAVAGRSATQIYEGERRFHAVVRYPERFRNNLTEIRRIVLRAADGAQVPLQNVARVEVSEGISQIKREGAKRRVVVGVNVQGRDLGGFVKDLRRRVESDVELPQGYYFEWGGQFENMQRAQDHLKVIIPITIAAIFFLLFLLFNSVRFATLIILVLPFASVGGVLGLLVSGEYLSVPASVGFIALWGIAVLNGVVLVSYVRGLRESGMDQQRAILEGSKMRFRPVMMTATVAALGLVPFLFATGPGSEVQRPLAVVVIGGLMSSTLLTLVVVPALYSYFEPKGPVAQQEEGEPAMAAAEA
ncbi:MAG: efflux RND transporter permease subunit [Acidobacteria bacterium]|nr:efflux RND transporter permease subunit [Acidobacteriota bacterium]